MGDLDDENGRRDHLRQPSEVRLAQLAKRQLGVVSLEQLYGLGFTYDRIRTLVRRGWLHPLYRNVYAVGHLALVPRAYLLAALLSVGSSSFLSHRTAAAVWGLRPINTHEIDVTVPGAGVRPRCDGLKVHRTRQVEDVRTNGHLRVSAPVRMLVELAPRETPAELERLVTEAVRRRLLRPELRSGLADLEAALARYERRPGVGRLRAALASYRRTEDRGSALERAFERFLGRHPEIPPPQHNVHLNGWELRYTDFRFEHDQPGILGDLHHFLAR